MSLDRLQEEQEWLDRLPAPKYAININGVTKIMTKSDVLSGFDKIKVCTAYKLNGKTTSELPYDMNSTEITPLYESSIVGKKIYLISSLSMKSQKNLKITLNFWKRAKAQFYFNHFQLDR